MATASGNAGMVGKLAEGAEKDGKTNVAFLTYFLQGRWVEEPPYVSLPMSLDLVIFNSYLFIFLLFCSDWTNVWSSSSKPIGYLRLRFWREHICPARCRGNILLG